MTKYQIDPDPAVWNGIHELKPQGCNLDEFVEVILALIVAENAAEVADDHAAAAERVLEYSRAEVEQL